MDIIHKIMNQLDDIEFGFKDKNGNNLISDKRWENDFPNFYYLLSPAELLETKCGVCWDQVELERKLFNDSHIDCDTYFIYIDDHANLPSHSFLTFQLDGKFYWFEHSWYDMKGIHAYDSIEALLTDVKARFLQSREDEIDPNSNYDTFIYKYRQPEYHLSYNEFYDYIKTQKRINI